MARMHNTKEIKSILRVNHAGELGARQIYKAQLKVLGNDPDLLQMAKQEEMHLKTFTKLMIEHRVKPTVFQPLWHVLSYGMGACTALMGTKAAHACTIVVEEIIVDHYQEQIDALSSCAKLQPLKNVIEAFKRDEDHHKELATANGGRDSEYYPGLEKIIKAITTTAIKISKKI